MVRNYLILHLLILTFFFIQTLKPPVDLDLGWHLRYGQYFFQTGSVLKDNILSFVWPNYKWVQASWSYDLLVYQIFTNFGFLGLSLAGALTTLTIFLLITSPIKRFSFFQYLFLATVFLTQSIPIYSTGLRAQTISALLFTVILLLSSIGLEKNKPKLFIFLPILFLIWANLHGGFSLGLIILFLLWIGHAALIIIPKLKFIKLKVHPINFRLFFAFGGSIFFSILTPLFNPWGLRIYEETLKHTSNTNLSIITEWTPLTDWGLLVVIISSLVAITTFLVLIFLKKFNSLPYILVLALLTFLTFNAIRFLIVFAVFVTYVLAQNLTKITFQQLSNRMLHASLKIGLVIILILDLFIFNTYFSLPPNNISTFSWNDYCNFKNDCSEELIQVIKKDIPHGNGYHPYGFGGYLAWRVPELKTFVDPRMAAWEKDGQTPPVILTNQVITSQNPLPFKTLNSEFQFSWIIIPTQSTTSKYLDILVKAGSWKKLYQDEFYSYFTLVE